MTVFLIRAVSSVLFEHDESPIAVKTTVEKNIFNVFVDSIANIHFFVVIFGSTITKIVQKV